MATEGGPALPLRPGARVLVAKVGAGLVLAGLLGLVVLLAPSSAPQRRQVLLSPGERLLRLQVSRLEDELETAVLPRLETEATSPSVGPGPKGAAPHPTHGGAKPRFLLIAGLKDAGQARLVEALTEVAPGHLHCDATLSSLMMMWVAAKSAEDWAAAARAFDARVVALLKNPPHQGAQLYAINGCSAESEMLFPLAADDKARKMGAHTVNHADLPQLEKHLRTLGSDLTVAYVQDDDGLYGALMDDPGAARTHADNLRTLSFYMMQVQAPVGCLSMSQPSLASAERLLQALGMFPAEDLAPKLVEQVLAGAPQTHRPPPPREGNLWAHSSLLVTLEQVSEVCGNVTLPAWMRP